jgi:hypothetical protein
MVEPVFKLLFYGIIKSKFKQVQNVGTTFKNDIAKAQNEVM